MVGKAVPILATGLDLGPGLPFSGPALVFFQPFPSPQGEESRPSRYIHTDLGQPSRAKALGPGTLGFVYPMALNLL